MMVELDAYLDGGGVDFELAEDGERLLVELAGDGDVGDVRSVVVVETVDVLHDADLSALIAVRISRFCRFLHTAARTMWTVLCK